MNTLKTLGFTLIELMVTVSIAAIVLTLGVPGYTQMIQNNRMSTAMNEFAADLSLARSEAIKRGKNVTLCKINEGQNACNSSGSWINGWIVFADHTNTGVRDDGEELIRVHNSLQGLAAIVFTRNRVTFDALGASLGFNGTVTFCDTRGLGDARGKVLSNNGRLRDAEPTDTLSCP